MLSNSHTLLIWIIVDCNIDGLTLTFSILLQFSRHRCLILTTGAKWQKKKTTINEFNRHLQRVSVLS